MNNGRNGFDSISNEEVYRRFIDGVSQWNSTGNSPIIASLDLRYAFDLQRKRLENKGVILTLYIICVAGTLIL